MPETVRVLCVDDEINILNVIRRQVCDLDLELHQAVSAEEGLQFLQQMQPVQVVISDYRLPGMDGIEFLKIVHRAWPAITKILLSGFADVSVVHEALEQKELFAFLSKPWKAEELRNAIIEAAADNRPQNAEKIVL